MPKSAASSRRRTDRPSAAAERRHRRDPNDAGANLLKDNTQTDKVNVVNNEEQPVDLSAQTARRRRRTPPAARWCAARSTRRSWSRRRRRRRRPPPLPGAEAGPHRLAASRRDADPGRGRSPAGVPTPSSAVPGAAETAGRKSRREGAARRGQRAGFDAEARPAHQASAQVLGAGRRRQDRHHRSCAARRAGRQPARSRKSPRRAKARRRRRARRGRSRRETRGRLVRRMGGSARRPAVEAEAKGVVLEASAQNTHPRSAAPRSASTRRTRGNGEAVYRVRVTGLRRRTPPPSAPGSRATAAHVSWRSKASIAVPREPGPQRRRSGPAAPAGPLAGREFHAEGLHSGLRRVRAGR